jgi:hypothetical protein
MNNDFHAVDWMRKVREELDRENEGKPLKAMLDSAHEKVSHDPFWKDLLQGSNKGIPVKRLVKGA